MYMIIHVLLRQQLKIPFIRLVNIKYISRYLSDPLSHLLLTLFSLFRHNILQLSAGVITQFVVSENQKSRN